ncbi:hypothetical protein CL176_09180 [Suicoccus acidiformans]|uniref:Uncharacterized protein n=1 Tax=Suicoccus acidiformans TaxID=2036206 RepID=A0A347WM50_9LACT|nr:hypothetical protein [Suicoccus acidiformans]AXY26157.1 hypothetical protein CL176_09180 [Suicoccus acidiformans]
MANNNVISFDDYRDSNHEPRSPEKSIQLMQQAIQEVNHFARIKLLQEAIQLDPYNFQAYIYLYNSPLDLLNGPAMEVFVKSNRRWIRKNRPGWENESSKNFLRFKFIMAQALMDIGKLTEAEMHFRELYEADESDALGARYKLVAIYTLTYQWDKAYELAELEMEHSGIPFSEFMLVPLMILAVLTGREETAELYFKDLIQRNPYLDVFINNEDPPFSFIHYLSTPEVLELCSIESLALSFSDIVPVLVTAAYANVWLDKMYSKYQHLAPERTPEQEEIYLDYVKDFLMEDFESMIDEMDDMEDMEEDEFLVPWPDAMPFEQYLELVVPWQGREALQEAGLTTVHAIEQAGANKLLKLKGVGPGTIESLRDYGIEI